MKYALSSVAAVSVLLAMTACGGGGGTDPMPISVAFNTAPPSTLAIGTPASLAAIVSNDPSNGGVNWSVTCASTNCGSFSATTTSSGTSTVYTPPASIPNPATVTIVATAVAGGVSASGVVAITAPGVPLLADGTYVYRVSGQNNAGPYTAIGAFAIASGRITGGEQDYSDPNGGYTNSLRPATSSISSADGNLQIALDTGNSAIGVNGVETLRATAVSATRLLVSNFDASATGTGSINLQTSTSAPAAGYAFAVSGSDTSGNPIAIGGVLNLSGTTLAVGASVFDLSVFNAATNSSAVLRGQAFQSGSVSAPDPYGRVVFSLTPTVASGVAQFALAGYVQSQGRIELVESAQANDALNANTGGSALGQGINTGNFDANSASVVNQSYAHGSVGADANGGAVMAGGFALNAGGNLGGILAVNDLTNVGAWQLNGTYTVEPTGRVTVNVTSLTSPTAPSPATTMNFELYLDGNGNAMVLGADAFQTTQGIAFEQDGAPALAGNYALSAQGSFATNTGGLPWSAVGPVAVNAGIFSGATDYNVAGGAPQSAQTLGGVQDTTRGLLQLTGLDVFGPSSTMGYGYYPVSGNRLWAIEVDHQGTSLLLMEQATR
jgi:hypothetical protein